MSISGIVLLPESIEASPSVGRLKVRTNNVRNNETSEVVCANQTKKLAGIMAWNLSAGSAVVDCLGLLVKNAITVCRPNRQRPS